VTICSTVDQEPSAKGTGNLTSQNTFAARTSALIVEQVNDEALIYDTDSDVAHSVSATAFAVWHACHGGATIEQVTEMLADRGEPNAEALAAAVLIELEEKNLLLGDAPAGVSRRHALRRMAGVGAAAALAPFVVSVTVPTAQAAGSPPTCKGSGVTCTGTDQTTNNCCSPGSAGGVVLVCGPPAGPKTCQACAVKNTRPFGLDCNSTTRYGCCSGTCRTTGTLTDCN
jgi:hypothetical protein